MCCLLYTSKDEDEITAYLTKILNKEAFDKSGLIYGIGHAVYSVSDPRSEVIKGFVPSLAKEKGREDELELYNTCLLYTSRCV